MHLLTSALLAPTPSATDPTTGVTRPDWHPAFADSLLLFLLLMFLGLFALGASWFIWDLLLDGRANRKARRDAKRQQAKPHRGYHRLEDVTQPYGPAAASVRRRVIWPTNPIRAHRISTQRTGSDTPRSTP